MENYLTVKLPLSKDESSPGGYKLVREHVELVRQNFKNLLFTIPGERVMMPEFGIGIESFLFETRGMGVEGIIRDRIERQVERYMSYIRMTLIEFEWTDMDSSVSIRMRYNIVPIRYEDEMDITLTLD